jgi:hypothetical protein
MEFERGIWTAGAFSYNFFAAFCKIMFIGWYLALEGDLRKVESMIVKDSGWVNRPDSAGYTALHYAARAGHLTICEKLLKSGAIVDATTKAG